MFINADVVKVVSEVLYIAVTDSLRQQFYSKMSQVGRERKISDSHRKGYHFPMYEKYQGVQQFTTRLSFALFSMTDHSPSLL